MSLMVATTPVKLAAAVEHLGGAHHHQPLHAIAGMQPDPCSWGAAGVLVQTHPDPASPFANKEHLKDFLAQCSRSISPEVMPNSFSPRTDLTPVMAGTPGRTDTRASESWSNTDSKTTSLLPAWSEL